MSILLNLRCCCTFCHIHHMNLASLLLLICSLLSIFRVETHSWSKNDCCHQLHFQYNNNNNNRRHHFPGFVVSTTISYNRRTRISSSSKTLSNVILLKKSYLKQVEKQKQPNDYSFQCPVPLQASSTTKEEDNNNNNNNKDNLIKMLLNLIGSTTSIFVSAVFFITLAYKRDALMVSFFIGSIANGILSKVLKKIINQTRPPELDETNLKLKPSDGGMPSSHAMSLGFICTFTALNLPWTQIPLVSYVIISLIYRVQAKLHTTEQIVVGVILGCLNGYGWYQLCLNGVWGDITVLQLVTKYCLNEEGILPWPMMIFPALIGAATVGSIERRIALLFKKNKRKE